MADIPEDVKKLAAASMSDTKANIAQAQGADVQPQDGFAKVASSSSRGSLVVETPAAAQPAAMDTDALTKARAAKQKSVWEEQVSQVPTKEAGEDKRDLDHDLDR